MTIRKRIEAIIASLDRMCPACAAANSQESWDALHSRPQTQPCGKRPRVAR